MSAIQVLGRRRSARVVFAGLALMMAVAALTAPSAQAQSSPDLGSIVIGNLAGYEPGLPGRGWSGPLTMEQLAELGIVPDVARRLLSSGDMTYARSFVGPDEQTTVIVAFDCGSAFKARILATAARNGAAELGSVARVSGLDDAFRVEVSPDIAGGMSAQQLYFRSGQLGFYILMLDRQASPVTDARIMEVATAQAAVVPPGVGRAGEAQATVGVTLGRMLFVVIAFALTAGPIVLLVVVFTRRRRRRSAPAPWSPQPPSTPQEPWI